MIGQGRRSLLAKWRLHGNLLVLPRELYAALPGWATLGPAHRRHVDGPENPWRDSTRRPDHLKMGNVSSFTLAGK